MAEEKDQTLKVLDNGNLHYWIESGGSIHLKAVDKRYGDPVELSKEEAKELAYGLLEYVALLEDEESPSINLPLSFAESLVLFEMLSRFGDGFKELDVSEQQALRNLQCLLEKKMTAPFKANYKDLLAKARQTLKDEAGVAR